MKRNTLTLVVIIILILIIGGILLGRKSSNSTNTTTPSTTNSSSQNQNSPSSTGAISIHDMMFSPSQITVTKGSTVTWTNNDSTTHTVVDDLSNVGGPSSGNILPGQTYSFTFDKTGSFQYHCSIHPSMRGTIVVK